jgi:hypothetical protein
MRKWIIWRGGVALGLASALLVSSLGCQPAGSSNSTSGTNKPTTQKPENKDKPGKRPADDPG